MNGKAGSVCVAIRRRQMVSGSAAVKEIDKFKALSEPSPRRPNERSKKRPKLALWMGASIAIHATLGIVLGLTNMSHPPPEVRRRFTYVTFDFEDNDKREGSNRTNATEDTGSGIEQKDVEKVKKKLERRKKDRRKTKKIAKRKKQIKARKKSRRKNPLQQKKNNRVHGEPRSDQSDSSDLLSMRNSNANPILRPEPQKKRIPYSRLMPKTLDGIGQKYDDWKVSMKGVETITYDDGGRLHKNVSGGGAEIPERDIDKITRTPKYLEPQGKTVTRFPKGSPVDLKGLAKMKIGERGTGHTLCSFYSQNPSSDKKRELYLILDSSGSMDVGAKISSARICAAAMAESALDNDYRVAIVNFSGNVFFQPPTSNRKLIYRAIGIRLPGLYTFLPELKPRMLMGSPNPRDYVLLSDGLLTDVFPSRVVSHAKAISSNPRNRAYYYAFSHNEAWVKRLKKAGYKRRFVVDVLRNK